MKTLSLQQRIEPVELYLKRNEQSHQNEIRRLVSQTEKHYLQQLNTDPKTGLNQEQVQFSRKEYGTNQLPKKQSKTCCQLFIGSLDDDTLKILMAAAVLSIIVNGIFADTPDEKSTFWIEGVVILAAVAVCSLVATFNDLRRQEQFDELSLVEEHSNLFEVRRNGAVQEVFREDIVVGDVILLKGGLQVPADGLVIEASQLAMGESSITGEAQAKYKNTIEKVKKCEHVPNAPSAVVISGTKVLKGKGQMVALVVGAQSSHGKLNEMIQGEDPEATPLEKKLEDLSYTISYFGLVCGLAVFVALTVWLLIAEIIPEGWDSSKHFDALLDYLMLGVVIIVIAVPEGLPLAVTISLAYSIKQMVAEECLVRRLACCETMGAVHVICTDKTGTLTQNKMTVKEVWNGQSYDESCYDSAPFLNRSSTSSSNYKDLVYNCIVYNSDATLQPVRKGLPTELALLEYAQHLKPDQPISRDSKPFLTLPFDSDRKRSTTGVEINGKKYIFMVGGNEIIMGASNGFYAIENSLKRSQANKLTSDMSDFTSKGNRVVGLAFKEVKSFDENSEKQNDEGVWSIEQKGFKMLLMISIQDNLRPESPEAIHTCKQAGVAVIMVTGDSGKTARKIADEVGITRPQDRTESLCMSGDQFQKLASDCDPHTFHQRCKDLRVVFRSRPEHKLLLVQNLKKINNLVAVTGDGTNDAPALKAATVGVSMGKEGTQVAKNASDIVILDDNFQSIVRSMVWGRNVYDSIKKFLQFQLTINFVACVFSVAASILFKQSVLTTVQMLWINMIMDSLAALALATEPPNEEEVLKRLPENRSASLLTPTMIKHIIGQSLFQIVILMVLVVKGQDFLPEYEDGFDSVIGSDLQAKYTGGQLESTMVTGLEHPLWGGDSYKPVFEKYHVYSRHLTFIFNLFVFMQVFNFFNCRVINDQLNILQGLHRNSMFWIINGIIVLIQWVIITFLNKLFNCYSYHGLTLQQWLICLLIAFSVIPFSLLLRILPFWQPQETFQAQQPQIWFRDRQEQEQPQQSVKKDEEENKKQQEA